MRQAFQAFLALFGAIVIAISLAHLAIGPRAIIGGVAVNPTMAGEDRASPDCFCAVGSRCCGAHAMCIGNAST